MIVLGWCGLVLIYGGLWVNRDYRENPSLNVRLFCLARICWGVGGSSTCTRRGERPKQSDVQIGVTMSSSGSGSVSVSAFIYRHVPEAATEVWGRRG